MGLMTGEGTQLQVAGVGNLLLKSRVLEIPVSRNGSYR